MSRTSILFSLLIPSLAGASGCVLSRAELRSYTPPGGVERGVVFSVDGAGGFQAASGSLLRAVEKEGLPLRLEPVIWSHGLGRVWADHTDVAHVRVQGRHLAERVAAYRQACPDGAIYLVGHSAGGAVALAAVETLPPATVDRVVLLSPALSADYDLRAALRGVRSSVEVFCSRRDWFYLGLGTSLLGTTDRRWGAASGRVGFRPAVTTAEDAALYAKLRQHPWHPCQVWTGHLGGHYGAYQPAFLRSYVLPLLQRDG